jgi:hypothetical protein
MVGVTWGRVAGMMRGKDDYETEKLQHTHEGKRIRPVFQDEARIGQKGRTCHIWWRRGERPPGAVHLRLFAAVEPGTDNAFALVVRYVNTDAMQAFLDRFSETIAEDEHVALVLDQAGWHGSGALAVPDYITLLPLPQYSPEINPVERVWLCLKESFLSYRLLADYDASAETGRITLLCSCPWILDEPRAAPRDEAPATNIY